MDVLLLCPGKLWKSMLKFKRPIDIGHSHFPQSLITQTKYKVQDVLLVILHSSHFDFTMLIEGNKHLLIFCLTCYCFVISFSDGSLNQVLKFVQYWSSIKHFTSFELSWLCCFAHVLIVWLVHACLSYVYLLS